MIVVFSFVNRWHPQFPFLQSKTHAKKRFLVLRKDKYKCHQGTEYQLSESYSHNSILLASKKVWAIIQNTKVYSKIFSIYLHTALMFCCSQPKTQKSVFKQQLQLINREFHLHPITLYELIQLFLLFLLNSYGALSRLVNSILFKTHKKMHTF